jgi:3-oxoacyl-[acyl-carrier protein] reductase
MSEKQKIVIVTGATRGLGLAISQFLVAENYLVIGVGRTITKEVNELVDGGNFHFERFDFAETEHIHEFAKTISKKYGRIWGLVNNAAIGNDGVLATLHESDIAKLIKVNIEAPILLTKYLLRPMLINRAGRVINVSSIIASTGFSGLSVYGATKAALVGFTKSLSREVGKAGITVNAIAPGYMETEMTQDLQGEKLLSIKRRSPLGYLAAPQDVAYTVAHLMSEKAKSITGTVYTIDAGSTA